MRIGIDIDGVIIDLARFMLDYSNKFYYDNGIAAQMNEEEYDDVKALGLTQEQTERFWNTYLEFYATRYPARDFACEVIHKLKQNHEIYIITARNEYGLPKEIRGTMQSMVKKWLSDNSIEYDKLIFTEESKLPYCLENEIDVMIEDSPYNIKDIATEVSVFCFDNPYNRKIEGKNITRVYSWYDILSKIEDCNLNLSNFGV